MADHCIIILAAGESSRMGEPKQLLPYRGLSLIEHAFITASNACEYVTVVLGANAEEILDRVPAITNVAVINENWKNGMGSSISFGLNAVLSKLPELNSAVFMTADPPFITALHLKQLLGLHKSSAVSIAASSYNDVAGIPALFGSIHFPDLLKLNADKGAKELIRNNPQNVVKLPFAGAAFDVDTQDEYAALE